MENSSQLSSYSSSNQFKKPKQNLSNRKRFLLLALLSLPETSTLNNTASSNSNALSIDWVNVSNHPTSFFSNSPSAD
ncbi:hypothetical protein MTR_4g114920 [Medicago truncatula]|uniref:Uncharacterized protein n=1 Tax=Medicago truncatula TaxID=3880 RepID=G7JE60_MEDTR|nr:hypothetical protein MTR_4g114920 [Medicago truncatula]